MEPKVAPDIFRLPFAGTAGTSLKLVKQLTTAWRGSAQLKDDIAFSWCMECNT